MSKSCCQRRVLHFASCWTMALLLLHIIRLWLWTKVGLPMPGDEIVRMVLWTRKNIYWSRQSFELGDAALVLVRVERWYYNPPCWICKGGNSSYKTSVSLCLKSFGKPYGKKPIPFEVIAMINQPSPIARLFIMLNKTLKTSNTQDAWLQKPLKRLSHRTLQTSHPQWSESELNQAILMLDLKQDNPYGDLGVILT